MPGATLQTALTLTVPIANEHSPIYSLVCYEHLEGAKHEWCSNAARSLRAFQERADFPQVPTTLSHIQAQDTRSTDFQ